MGKNKMTKSERDAWIFGFKTALQWAHKDLVEDREHTDGGKLAKLVLGRLMMEVDDVDGPAPQAEKEEGTMKKHIIIALGLAAMGCNTIEPVDGTGGAPASSIDQWENLNGSVVDLPPGSAQELCQSFASPFGQDVQLDELIVRGDPNTFGVEIYMVDGAVDGAIGPCQTETDLLYGGDPRVTAQLNDVFLGAHVGLVVRARFINESVEAQDGFVVLRLHAK